MSDGIEVKVFPSSWAYKLLLDTDSFKTLMLDSSLEIFWTLDNTKTLNSWAIGGLPVIR